VQAGAFKSRENADRLAARLKAKGYAAAVLVTSSKSVPFHVRVGPLGDRSEAQRAAARIQREEGQKPSVTH
jgi:cell division septation protein DedD